MGKFVNMDSNHITTMMPICFQLLHNLHSCHQAELSKALICIDPNNIPHETEYLLDYFEDTWIGRTDKWGWRRVPKFIVDTWLCYDRVEKDLKKKSSV